MKEQIKEEEYNNMGKHEARPLAPGSGDNSDGKIGQIIYNPSD